MKYEYRVRWKREGNREKQRRYARQSMADRFVGLFGPEPWTVYAPGDTGDDYVCCPPGARDCACDGLTHKQKTDEDRATMPALEYVKIERREVGEWKP